MSENFPTSVKIKSIDKICNFRILFGSPYKKTLASSKEPPIHIEDWFFIPGSIFCLDLFTRNQYGSTEWAVYVLQAAYPGETIVPVPQVTPGAKILLEAHGKKQVQAAIKELAEIQERVDPATLPPGRFLLTDFRLKADARTRR